MTFTSPYFLVFIVCVWLAYFVLPRAYRWMLLLGASIAFYIICGGLIVGFWLVLCTVITYAGALLLKELENIKAKRITLAVALIMVFGLLSVFKFTGFAAQLLPGILGKYSAGLLLPLGISFYIFQTSGYLIDVYRGKYEPQRNLAKYALFASFFPQIVQGPIGRYNTLAPQLLAGERPTADSYKYGIQLIMWGLFKKMILADRAAVLVTAVFSAPESHGGIVSIVAAAFYCIQIYCDFSGGIDISRGIAEGLGIKLDKNFEQPLFAISVQDFWRRWHMTLGSWMRDYLFYPLSLSKAFGRLGKKARRVLGMRIGKLIPSLAATFIVFFTIGVWHGGAWKYIIFGVWNGLLISGAMLLKPQFDAMRKGLRVSDDSKPFYLFRVFRTLVIVGAGRIMTRAATASDAFIMLKKIFTSPKTSHIASGALMKLGLTAEDYIIIAAAMLILLAADIIEERGIRVRTLIERRNPVIQAAIIVIALTGILYYGAYRSGYVSAQFLYAGF